jgi:hypothetical protein
MSSLLYRSTPKFLSAWSMLCVVALSAWTPLQLASAGEPATQTVLVGQAYGPDLVLLQSAAKPKPGGTQSIAGVELAALHAAGAARLPPSTQVTWQAALPPVRPQRIAGLEKPDFARCTNKNVTGVPVVAMQAAPVPHRELADWFDPGAPGHCEDDEGLAQYTGLTGLDVGVPVLGYAGFGGLKADYLEAGRARPMSEKERLRERAYEAKWRVQYKRLYGKPFNAKEFESGPIQTLADAKNLLVLRNERGEAVLRVSMWESVSPSSRLTRVLLVDHMRDARVSKTWTFYRSQGNLW